VVARDGRPVMSLEEYAPTFNLMHKHTHDAMLALGSPQDAESRQVAMRRAQLAFNKEVEQERANHKLWLLPLGELSADEQYGVNLLRLGAATSPGEQIQGLTADTAADEL
jgi:hypothetical protein